MDPETARVLRLNQERVERLLKQLQPMSQEEWDQQPVTDHYTMESTIFDYQQISKSELFGIKQYRDSIYRGELVDGKR